MTLCTKSPFYTHRVSIHALLDESREMALVLLRVIVSQVAHVICHMTSQETVPQLFRVQGVALTVVSNEAFHAAIQQLKYGMGSYSYQPLGSSSSCFFSMTDAKDEQSTIIVQFVAKICISEIGFPTFADHLQLVLL